MVREADARCKGSAGCVSRSLPVLRHPGGGGGVRGGEGSAEPGLQSLHACVTAGLGTRLSPPRGEAMAQQSRGPLPPLRPGTGAGRGADPTYHAGRGRGGSGELALRLRTRPARTVQVMVPAGSGSPPPMQRNRCPTRAPRGPSKKSSAPRPASLGTPGTIHLDPPAPPQGN